MFSRPRQESPRQAQIPAGVCRRAPGSWTSTTRASSRTTGGASCCSECGALRVGCSCGRRRHRCQGPAPGCGSDWIEPPALPHRVRKGGLREEPSRIHRRPVHLRSPPAALDDVGRRPEGGPHVPHRLDPREDGLRPRVHARRRRHTPSSVRAESGSEGHRGRGRARSRSESVERGTGGDVGAAAAGKGYRQHSCWNTR